MDMLEMILLIAFVIFLIFIMICSTWTLIVQPYLNYHLHKENNKLQWKCIETQESFERRKNHIDGIYLCSVSYRILPSELNKFVRIFTDNDWHNPFKTYRQFKSENDFKEFIKDWKTYGDIKHGIGCLILFEPPIDE